MSTLTELYQFPLFVKMYRYNQRISQKVIAIDFKIDSSKLSRMENGKIPFFNNYEEAFLTYFEINNQQFIESNAFYTKLYYETLDNIVMMNYQNLLELTKKRIKEFKKVNSIISPLEPIILFASSLMDINKKSYQQTKEENTHYEFIDSNIHLFSSSVKKTYLILKSYSLYTNQLYEKAYELLKHIYKNYPSNQAYDSLLYTNIVVVGNTLSFLISATEFYQRGKELCIKFGALRRVAFLDINYTDYLRNTGHYHEALKQDLYTLTIVNQLKNKDDLYYQLLYRIGLDYLYLKNYGLAKDYFMTIRKKIQSPNQFFIILFTLHKLNDKENFQKLYREISNKKRYSKYNEFLFNFIQARNEDDHSLCEKYICELNENYLALLSISEKKLLIYVINEFYEHTNNYEKLVYYDKIVNSFLQ